MTGVLEAPSEHDPASADDDQLDLAALVMGARSGDVECWHRLVSRFHEQLIRTATASGTDRSTASDLVQQTWLAAWTHLGSLREPAAFAGWLRTILRREVIKECRRRRREAPHDDLEAGPYRPMLVVEVPSPESAVLRDEELRLLRAARQRLPQRDKDLLALLTESPAPAYAEVSRRMRMPVGSIGPTRGRCMARLRSELEQLGHDRV